MTRQTKVIKPEIIVKAETAIVKKSIDLSTVTMFLDALDVRPLTKELYRKGVLRFMMWMESNNIAQPARQDILNFKTYLIELNLAVSTVNSYLTSVKMFFNFLQTEKLYLDVAKGVKGLKQPRGHLRETPSVDQVKSMLAKVDTSTIDGKRNFAILNLCARTGLRTIEITRANVEDLRQEGGEALLFVQGKGRDSKDEFVLIIDATLTPILRYLKARGKKTKPDEPLFISHSDRNKGQRLTTRTIRKISKDAYRSIQVDDRKLSAHSLRHFFATQSLKSGAELIQVKETLRHSSIQTTEKYLHNLDRIERAAERFIDF